MTKIPDGYRAEPNPTLATDESCFCGHLRRLHADSLYESGHGGCRFCSCARFTWNAFVRPLAKEA